MEGRLTKLRDVWNVRYYTPDLEEIDPVYCGTLIPIHPNDIKSLGNQFKESQKVEFEIVDEFTHQHLFHGIPWGDGIRCAKLKIDLQPII